MMLPSEVTALAEARREAFERELQLQQRLAQIPPRPPRWRIVTGSGLMWAGNRLVRWGNGLATPNRSQTIHSIG